MNDSVAVAFDQGAPALAALIRRVESAISEHHASVRALIKGESLRDIASRYEETLGKRRVELGFNVFTIVADHYFRENFHSDLIAHLLNPGGAHGEGAVYLKLFLQLLLSHGAKLRVEDFSAASVMREEGRVDILIADEKSKRAIIIENKMNGAMDMPRQIPRYLDLMERRGLRCDVIVYLRLNRKQFPDQRDWSPVEARTIGEKLVCLLAYDETPRDLLNGWIRRAAEFSKNSDASFALRQYDSLVRKLGADTMNKVILDEFYQLMLEGDHFRAATSISSMLRDLTLFRVQRIIDCFSHELHPFKAIANHKDIDAYLTGVFVGNAHLGLDVVVESDRYILQFWDRNDRIGSRGEARQFIEAMGLLSEFKMSGGLFEKIIPFPEREAELFDEIRAFQHRLASAISVGSSPSPQVSAIHQSS